MISLHLDVPLRLGFFVAELGVPIRNAQAYRGLDRLPRPHSIAPEDISKLPQPWWDYFDAFDDDAVQTDMELALALSCNLESIGVSTEVIYAEITAWPQPLGHYKASFLWEDSLRTAMPALKLTHALVSRPSQRLSFLGYDISDPVPYFHSAIRNDNLDKIELRRSNVLNQHDLIRERGDALRLLEFVNAENSRVLPFCIISVWHVREELGP